MYSRLLVPLDGSATAELALHHAAALARLSGATLVLLHVIEEMKHCNGFERPQVYVEQVRPGFLAAGQALLDAAAARLRGQGLTVETLLIESKGEREEERNRCGFEPSANSDRTHDGDHHQEVHVGTQAPGREPSLRGHVTHSTKRGERIENDA